MSINAVDSQICDFQLHYPHRSLTLHVQIPLTSPFENLKHLSVNIVKKLGYRCLPFQATCATSVFPDSVYCITFTQHKNQ